MIINCDQDEGKVTFLNQKNQDQHALFEYPRSV